jgi:hypothetical protein
LFSGNVRGCAFLVDREKDSHLTKPSSDDGAYLGVYVRFYPDYTSTTGETAVVPMMVQRRGLIDVLVLGRVAYRIAGLAKIVVSGLEVRVCLDGDLLIPMILSRRKL